MMAGKIKVIFDTNIWISFLIGKQLSSLKNYISAGQIQIVITSQLLKEIENVTDRVHLRKYFPKESVFELIDLLQAIAINVEAKQKHTLERDIKDSFLLDLIDTSKADYLVTGDKDLLELKRFMSAEILSVSNFEKAVLSKL